MEVGWEVLVAPLVLAIMGVLALGNRGMVRDLGHIQDERTLKRKRAFYTYSAYVLFTASALSLIALVIASFVS